ncbi:ATP synthase mitochondrial F1 complex assembly factor 2 [Coccomyxa sp. Obi]|nr:ATP synthase mitochondrial F1 complex assembly factor 2 [Coccomyxa sp. Obi]
MSRLRDAIAKILLTTGRPLIGHEPGRLHANIACSCTQAIRDTSTVAASRWQGHISVQEAEAGYQVYLDGRPLRTPARLPLVMPNRALALAVAAEWQWQDNLKIRPFTMPLMSLAATAIDQPKDRSLVIDTLLTYLHADAACCRDAPGLLSDRQALVYDPIIAWASKFLSAELSISDSIFGAQQPQRAVKAVQNYLEGLSAWQLAATEQLIGTCRSLLIGVAVAEGHLDLKQALQAARLEEEFQIDAWGLVEALGKGGGARVTRLSITPAVQG